MCVPDIHTCMKLTSENEDLRHRLGRVKEQRDEARKELKVLKDKTQLQDLLRNYVTTRESSVQTDPRTGFQPLFKTVQKKEEKEGQDYDKTNKILSMHTQLMRRYEKEVKQNMTHIETITDLNLQIADYEKKFRQEHERVLDLERELKLLQIRSRSRSQRSKGRSTSPASSGSEEDEERYRKLKKERDKLRKDNNKLKSELKGLDHGFFEEVEDIKFALQQSARLNQEYERTLRKLCMRFGVPYPHPEKILDR